MHQGPHLRRAFAARGRDLHASAAATSTSSPGSSPPSCAPIIGNYEGLAIRSATKVTAEVLAEAKKLKVVGRAGIGVDNVDLKSATAHGVVVMNTPFGNAITTAEHAIALMFAVARQVPAADASTQAGKWEKNRFMGTELSFKTLGLIGCGNIGSIVAERAIGLQDAGDRLRPVPERGARRPARRREGDPRAAAAARRFHQRAHAAHRADQNILGRANLMKTKKGVRIINCARGGLVDELAVRDLLDSGHIAGAGFDVFTEEPAKANVLFGAPNLVCTPHLGAGDRRGAGERGAAGRRADGGLPADRRDPELAQHAQRLGRGGAKAARPISISPRSSARSRASSPTPTSRRSRSSTRARSRR